MNSIPSVTIDAGVLAVPSQHCSINEAYKYIDILLDWSKLLDQPWVAIYMSERAAESLFADGLYPLREHLKLLFDTYSIVEYDVNTVAKVTNRLLTLTPSFEDYYRLKDVLTDSLNFDPDIVGTMSHVGMQSDLTRCITLIAILRKHCLQPPGDHLLILRDTPATVIKVRAQIHDIDHERDDIPSLPCPPEFFEGDVLICDDFSALIQSLDETAVLVNSSNTTGIQTAIRIALYKHCLANGDIADWDNAVIPIIGQEFLATFKRCCMDQSDSFPPKILRSIIETLNNENLSAVHALRTGPGGNDPQRMRGADRAQRRDIDREFHLHYWQCSNGTIELASVVYHNDFSIQG